MELKFKSNEGPAGLIAWIKSFKEIFPSLLIEVDVINQEFVAKSFPTEKSVVKFSKISFSDAGYDFIGVYDNEGNDVSWADYAVKTKSGRINIGLYNTIDKAIKVFERFNGAENELTISFDLCEDVYYIQAPSAEPEYEASDIKVTSLTLTMRLKCSQLSEFFYKLSDETFLNGVCRVNSPSVFEISSEVINNLIGISSVFVSSGARDSIKFYSKNVNGHHALLAFDNTGSNYDYTLGYHVDGVDDSSSTVVYRENFINATKGLNSDTIRIILDTAGASRILVETSNSKVVIAAVAN